MTASEDFFKLVYDRLIDPNFEVHNDPAVARWVLKEYPETVEALWEETKYNIVRGEITRRLSSHRKSFRSQVFDPNDLFDEDGNKILILGSVFDQLYKIDETGETRLLGIMEDDDHGFVAADREDRGHAYLSLARPHRIFQARLQPGQTTSEVFTEEEARAILKGQL